MARNKPSQLSNRARPAKDMYTKIPAASLGSPARSQPACCSSSRTEATCFRRCFLNLYLHDMPYAGVCIGPMVGDRLDTGIAMGRAGGLATVLALSSVASARANAAAAARGEGPDVTVALVAVFAGLEGFLWLTR
eukprot:364809-Chlamydomonas_euryale.AAC.17